MQFAAFGDLNLSTEQFFNGMGKRLADISAIGQDALNSLQISSTAPQSQQCPLAVSDLGGRDSDCVRQSLGIDRNVALDS